MKALKVISVYTEGITEVSIVISVNGWPVQVEFVRQHPPVVSAGLRRVQTPAQLLPDGQRDPKAFGPTSVVMLLAGSRRDVSMHWESWTNTTHSFTYTSDELCAMFSLRKVYTVYNQPITSGGGNELQLLTLL